MLSVDELTAVIYDTIGKKVRHSRATLKVTLSPASKIALYLRNADNSLWYTEESGRTIKVLEAVKQKSIEEIRGCIIHYFVEDTCFIIDQDIVKYNKEQAELDAREDVLRRERETSHH